MKKHRRLKFRGRKKVKTIYIVEEKNNREWRASDALAFTESIDSICEKFSEYAGLNFKKFRVIKANCLYHSEYGIGQEENYEMLEVLPKIKLLYMRMSKFINKIITK